MNVLSTRIHAILDYIIALTMCITPWLMGFDENTIENWLIIAMGCGKLLYSFCTDYELGFLEEIDVRTHLVLDFFIGILLMLSPWLLGFYDKIYLPFLVIGGIEIATTLVTKTDDKVFQNFKTSSKQSGKATLTKFQF